jgi:prepilin-type N-terminal cleavage/methylation domain-containing protein
MHKDQGFTLIELSIVLVIIGLIVGGVLVGQDLIKAAEVRATIGQVEKYNAAVNTFRTKYNGIPGDLTAATASAFGLFTFSAPAVGLGDGNGLIEGGAALSTLGLGEPLAFWRHLSDASLIDGAFGSSGNSAIVAASGATTGAVTAVNSSLPGAKLGRGNVFITYAVSGVNYYQLISVSQIATSGTYSFNAASVTPVEAFNIDSKLDDGAPNTGIVRARGIASANGAATWAASSAAGTCNIGTGGADDTYNRVAASGGNDPSCSLRFRFN